MSGYPYGNPPGGYPYPPNYATPYPPAPMPPPVPQYGGNQSCAEFYGTNPPNSHGFSSPQYGGNQSCAEFYGTYPPNSYGFSSPPPPPAISSGFAPYPVAPNYVPSPPAAPYPTPSVSASTTLYPNLSTPGNYNNAALSPSYQPPVSSVLASLEQYQGTVYPEPNFNPERDCHALNEAMRGLGTNERALIDIAANRSNSQRQQIKIQYKTMFGQDLIHQFRGELSGNFKETMKALFDPPTEYDAWSLRQALTNGKEGTLRELLLTRTNNEIRSMIDAYRRLFNRDVEKDINAHVLGKDFRRMLISAAQAQRDELSPQQIHQVRQMGIESVIDRHRARQDADDLYKAGVGKWGTDERTFNAIFARRSYYQLRAMFEEYQQKYRQDMAQVIRAEFSGDAKEAYLVLIQCIRDRASFFAERINKAVRGLGTNDSTLIRVIVTRSEIDLVQIKDRYQRMFGRSLADDVRGDTSGDYKRLLLAIVK